MIRYRLVVFPPGISDSERRRVRVARGWILWGALVWVFCEISLSNTTGPWTALVISTAIYLGLGLVVTAMAGDQRRQVRTIGASVMAGHHDPLGSALRRKVEKLAGALMEADELLARGEIFVDDPRDDMVAGVRPNRARPPPPCTNPAQARSGPTVSGAWIGAKFLVMPRIVGHTPSDTSYAARGW